MKGGVALAGRTVFAGSYDGYLYALDARRRPSSLEGRRRTARRPLRDALGGSRPSLRRLDERPRVRLLDRSGDQLWSVRTGSYVYSAAALAGATAYVGSYDHRLYALSQATGRTRWTFDAGAPISGAPTVIDGLVYFSTCGSCSGYESNPRARRTFALDAATGRLVWRFPDGEYSPVIADRERLYLTGFTSLYGLAPAG